MASTYSKAEYRFLLRVARQILTDRPEIKTAELARELHISVKAAYNYRRRIAAGEPDPPDPVQLARAYLLKHPRATAEEVGAALGLDRDSGKRYLLAALDDMTRNPPPPPTAQDLPKPVGTYRVPVFLKLKP